MQQVSQDANASGFTGDATVRYQFVRKGWRLLDAERFPRNFKAFCAPVIGDRYDTGLMKEEKMVNMVCFVGRSGSGKTTLIERLIPELSRRGYRVASIKHAKEVSWDSDKDSSRHLAAGSGAVALVSGNRLSVTTLRADSATDADAIYFLGNRYDIILCEGFKYTDAPKILLNPSRVGSPPDDVNGVIAEVTDVPSKEAGNQFGLDNVVGLADFIEKEFLRDFGHEVEVFLNDRQVPLLLSQQELITQIMLEVVSSIKGAGEVKNLEIRMQRCWQIEES